jgi:cytochrome P450
MPTTSDAAELPVIPGSRGARCPLKPPAEFREWRRQPGLRRVMYHGTPTWMVSRYQDIRAALVDPRLSADTIPAPMKPSGSGATAPVMFARVDDHYLGEMSTGHVLALEEVGNHFESMSDAPC